jgi:hypothetical protein
VIDFGRATDFVMANESPYDQEVIIEGKNVTLQILSTDEKGVEAIRGHLKEYVEYKKGQEM